MYLIDFSDQEDYWEAFLGGDMIADMRKNPPCEAAPCLNLLSDEALFRSLRSIKFDLAILDAFPNSRCFAILMYK